VIAEFNIHKALCEETVMRSKAKGKAMKRITINRDSSGNVEFETVTVDSTENVFFPQPGFRSTLADDRLESTWAGAGATIKPMLP
jgi:hypothetical protein